MSKIELKRPPKDINFVTVDELNDYIDKCCKLLGDDFIYSVNRSIIKIPVPRQNKTYTTKSAWDTMLNYITNCYFNRKPSAECVKNIKIQFKMIKV